MLTDIYGFFFMRGRMRGKSIYTLQKFFFPSSRYIYTYIHISIHSFLGTKSRKQRYTYIFIHESPPPTLVEVFMFLESISLKNKEG